MLPECSPSLPFVTDAIVGVGGVLRSTWEDFQVEEIPAYEASGEGDHTFVTFQKRGLTTPEAVDRLARAVGVSPRDAGYAGMKDRHAVTVQTASFPGGDAARFATLALEGITVRAAVPHRHKLRTGHLRGNRFVLVLRSVEGAAEALARCQAVAETLAAQGVANYYGSQRFGRGGDNEARARRWLVEGGRAPRDATERKMLASALQSAVFNRWLSARVAAGELGRYVDGDLATRHGPTGEGRPWAIDPAEAQGFYDARDVSPTGPMVGPKMPWPTGEALRREEALLVEDGLTVAHFAAAGSLAEGTRRAARIFPEGLSVALAGDDALRFEFVLPPGAYATVVMREFVKNQSPSEPVAALSC